MLKKTIAQALTEGLISGYAGKGNISTVKRAGFLGQSSHVETENGTTYHDEWFVPTHAGGGQELVAVGKDMCTRLYGGGTPAPEKLAQLGITADDVAAYLKRKIVELGDKTRLATECKPKPDGQWQYVYEILMEDMTIPVIMAAESIFYKKIRVHLHPFILSSLQ